MPSTISISIKAPSECTDSEIHEFCCFIEDGGEVSPAGLRSRIMNNAVSLIFLIFESKLAGVAAVKKPNENYRNAIFGKAGVPGLAIDYKFEIGWVYVPTIYRGRKFSRSLIHAALRHIDDQNILATSRIDNDPMRRTLERHGFKRVGRAYVSERGNYHLNLFLHNAETT